MPKPTLQGSTLECEICGELYVYESKRGHSSTRCRSCRDKLRRWEIKAKAVQYKGGKCVLCSYSTCNDALIFHHFIKVKGVVEKAFEISRKYFNWEALKEELDRTVLLCSNCHAEVHAGIIELSQDLVPKRNSACFSPESTPS